MVELRQRPRLAQQALAGLGIEPVFRVENLQRDLAIELLVVAGIDVAHAALSDDVGDADMTEPAADELHGCLRLRTLSKDCRL
jgi:hypothetical protein